MLERVIAVLRRPEGLFALVNRPKHPFRMFAKSRHSRNSFDELADFYEVSEKPLESLPATVVPNSRRLLRSWNSISHVREWDAQTLFHVLKILLETHSDPKAERAPVGIGPDLQKSLCDSRRQYEILQALRPFWPEALEKLGRAGYDVKNLSRIKYSSAVSADPYFAHHFAHDGNPREDKLPEMFCKFLLPALTGLQWTQVREVLALFWGLLLQRNQNLLLAISRLLNLAPTSNTFEWCRILESQPPNRRAVFVALLIETGAYRLAAGTPGPEFFREFCDITTKALYHSRLSTFLTALTRKVSIEYLWCGLRLAGKYSRDYRFQSPMPCPSFRRKQFEQLIVEIRKYPYFYPSLALEIWDGWAGFDSLDRVLKNPLWKNLPGEIAEDLLLFYLYLFSDDLTPAQRKELWSFVRESVPQVLTCVNEVPAGFQEKFLGGLESYHWIWKKTAERRKYFPPLYKTLLRVCRPPFPAQTCSSEVFSRLIQGSEKLVDAFLSAPQSSFLNVEKACRSGNDADLSGAGMETMLRFAPLFTIKSFRSHSARLMRTSKMLGLFSAPVRQEILRGFLQHPLIRQKFGKWTVPETVAFLREHLGSDLSSPVPKRLQQFVDGNCALTKERIHRYQRLMYEKLNFTKLELLEQTIRERTLREYPRQIADPESWQHTIQVMYQITKNRRALRRFLRFYVRGNLDYLVEHPQSRKWLDKHPELNRPLWSAGIPFVREVEPHGILRIVLENDPLEILKMGTYAGSCLGLGGAYIDSAAAVVLDINKKVLYARNNKNQVIGRQLIAFSEEGKVVCFSVYPKSVDPVIKKLFREYDLEFARVLKARRARSKEEYTIVGILSRGWYDDNAWNLTD